jgi:peptidase M48-like protein
MFSAVVAVAAPANTPRITAGAAPRSTTQAASRSPAVADSDAIALGDALLERFDADRGVVATPQSRAVEVYLQSVADSLGKHARRRLPWRVHYDPSPALKSGFALPGGRIVIWGGILSYMTTEDELAAILAHEIEHTDDGQVDRRIDSLITTQHRNIRVASQWTWDEFGASYGDTLENLCDFDGAKLGVQAGYSPLGFKMLLGSFVALAKVHDPSKAPPRAIVDRIAQIEREMKSQHWERLTTTRRLRLPQ